jgi:hypothetical protein
LSAFRYKLCFESLSALSLLYKLYQFISEKYKRETEKKGMPLSNLKMPSGSNGARHHPGAFCGRGP